MTYLFTYVIFIYVKGKKANRLKNFLQKQKQKQKEKEKIKMIKLQNKVLKIGKIERLKNSYIGNPKHRIVAIDEQGNIYEGKTATNASIGYLLDFYSEGKKYNFVFHETNKGNLIFDRAEKIEE